MIDASQDAIITDHLAPYTTAPNEIIDSNISQPLKHVSSELNARSGASPNRPAEQEQLCHKSNHKTTSKTLERLAQKDNSKNEKQKKRQRKKRERER